MTTTQSLAVTSGELPPSSSLDSVLADLGHDCPGDDSGRALATVSTLQDTPSASSPTELLTVSPRSSS